MGRIYLMQDEYPEGQAAFQRAIYKNPNAYVYWCSIGILYAIVRQATDAFECFVRASNLLADRVEVWYNMGVLYENCEQHHEAKLAYQRAMEIDFDFMDAASRI
mmetsp:Transcript_9019/g.1313  ORF Transcript_9019/g.1313 Transcript_9019/m.1313 type:complete len:104 (-) Transcript_9019:12-323(-)